jgi:hypothetical protein
VSWKVLTGNVSGIAVCEVEDLPIFMTKKEIRRMLHLEYNADDMPKHGNVLSGTNLSLAKQDFQAYERPLIKVHASSRPYCRYTREFRKLDEELCVVTLQAEEPYLEPERQRIRELRSSRGKWVLSKDFTGVTTSYSSIKLNSSTPIKSLRGEGKSKR